MGDSNSRGQKLSISECVGVTGMYSLMLCSVSSLNGKSPDHLLNLYTQNSGKLRDVTQKLEEINIHSEIGGAFLYVR